jgi:(p)ppGpp synthase/HD superfamily hydrolase
MLKHGDDWLLSRASDLHGNQRYGDNPYVYHLRKVLEKVKTYEKFYGEDPDLLRTLEMAAVFHDTLEDVPSYTYNDLKRDARKVFSDEFYVNMVAEIVYACTNDKGRTRAERAGEEYYKGIRETGYAPFIKACDRLANIEFAKSQGSSLYDKYIQEMPGFLKKIEEPGNLIPLELKEELCAYLVD